MLWFAVLFGGACVAALCFWSFGAATAGQRDTRRTALWCAAAAVMLAVVAAVFAAFSPMVESSGSGQIAGAEPYEWSERRSLFQSQGAYVLVVVSVPVLMTGAGLFAQRSGRRVGIRLGIGFVFGGLCLLTGFSIGMFFLPAAGLLLLSAVLDRDPADETALPPLPPVQPRRRAGSAPESSDVGPSAR